MMNDDDDDDDVATDVDDAIVHDISVLINITKKKVLLQVPTYALEN